MVHILLNEEQIVFHIHSMQSAVSRILFCRFFSQVNFAVTLTLIVVGGSESMEPDEDGDLRSDIFGPYSDSVDETP